MGEATRVDEVTSVLEIALVITIRLRDIKYDATVSGWKLGAFILLDCLEVNTGDF